MNRSRPRTQLTGKETTMYAIVHENGAIMMSLFATLGRAQSSAKYDGDSVIAVQIDLNREPLFIRRKVQKG